MKTLGEIRRNLVSFYSSIQNKITDFSVGSVVGGIFYSFSASLERVYEELEEVRRQAYVSTATGEYLDRLIEGTFQLERTPSTRAVGYVVVYGSSPISNFESIELRYADFDYETGEFLGGVQSSTKFVGYNVQGEEGVVFSLINPRNADAVVGGSDRLIKLERPTQFLLLPVASVLKGSRTNVREGGIYSFPSPPPGLSGVLNTSNPGSIFFSSSEAVSGAPFYSRFTEILGYNNSTSSFSTLNSFNFSNAGVLEITGNVDKTKSIVATYTNGAITRSAGLIFEYIDATTSGITLSLPIENSLDSLPKIRVLDGGSVVELTLTEFTYDGNLYSADDGIIRQFIEENIDEGLRIQQRPDQITNELIFDPDSVLTSEYRLIDSARVGGASDIDTDAQYRDSLRKYLASLSKATNVALEAGSLQIPGVAYAKTLPASLSPRGSAIILASDESGFLPGGLKGAIKEFLNDEWKAAGINIIVREPEVISLCINLTARLDTGILRNAVTQQINTTIIEYLSQIQPGGSLRYSDLLSAITDIGGVRNVFNLLLLKYLTNETYQLYKGQYDEEVLSRISSSGVVEVSKPSVTPYLPGDLPRYVDSSYDITTDVTQAVGILYRVVNSSTIEVFEGNPESLYNTYEALISNYEEAVTVDYLYNVLMGEYESLGVDSASRMYFLSYILSEPIEELSAENYPPKPLEIDYASIRDYDAEAVEIFRPKYIDIGTTPTIVVGINYI